MAMEENGLLQQQKLRSQQNKEEQVSSTSGSNPGFVRAGVIQAEEIMRYASRIPDGARKTVLFMFAEALSYGAAVVTDLDQARNVKIQAYVRWITANVPIDGPKYQGFILDGAESLPLVLMEQEEVPQISNRLEEENAQLREQLEAAEKRASELLVEVEQLQGDVARLSSVVEEADSSATSQSRQTIGDSEDTVSLVSDVAVLDAIELVAQSTLLKDTNQHMRCNKICEAAKRDGGRGRTFTDLKGIIQGVRDGTFNQWLRELQGDGLTPKSAGPFLTFKRFLTSEACFGDGGDGISIERIREELIPLLRKRGYTVITPG